MIMNLGKGNSPSLCKEECTSERLRLSFLFEKKT